MKKTYISPVSIVVRINTRSAILTTSYDQTQQAAGDATVFGRSFDLDED